MTQQTTAPYRQLRRPTDDRIVAGVCSGVGRYFGIDPTLVRVGLAVLAVISWGTALIAYPIMWFLMPEEPRPETAAQADPAGPAWGGPAPQAYTPPAYSATAPAYDTPAPDVTPPVSTFTPPAPTFTAPTPDVTPAAPTFDAPTPDVTPSADTVAPVEKPAGTVTPPVDEPTGAVTPPVEKPAEKSDEKPAL